jgi:hypothetical protein
MEATVVTFLLPGALPWVETVLKIPVAVLL